MAAEDILNGASAAFAMWDGRSTCTPSLAVGNNTSGKPICRFVPTYDISGWTSSPPTTSELGQTVAIGPKPILGFTAATYTALVSTYFGLDSSGGTINITMPADPYPGMVMIFKDTTASAGVHAVTISANVGQMVEEASSPGTYNSSSPNTATGFCCTYMWNPETSHWDLISYFH